MQNISQILSNFSFPLSVSYVNDSTLVSVIDAVLSDSNAKIEKALVVVLSDKIAKVLSESLNQNNTKSFYMPSLSHRLDDSFISSHDENYNRLLSLSSFLKQEDDKKHILVSSISSALDKVSSKNSFLENCFTLKLGDTIDTEKIAKKLVNLGYKAFSLVEGAASFSVRGDIFDIFVVNESRPIRIELGFDGIESIRYFDVLSQKSEENIDSITIIPAITSNDTCFLFDYFNDDKSAIILVEEDSFLERAKARLNDDNADVASLYKNHQNLVFINTLPRTNYPVKIESQVNLLVGKGLSSKISFEGLSALNTRKKTHKKHFSKGNSVFLSDLEIGDIVVHEYYGIAEFIGIKTIETAISKGDYIALRYLKGETLYVPSSSLDLITKYIGSANPKLSKLYSDTFKLKKAKVKKYAKDIAKNLIDVHAKRKQNSGFTFSEDTDEQKNFEEIFLYEETEDQLQAIKEIKEDMQKSKVMDRLLCGDVGVGKTEVALRAAFKCIQDKKQCALLSPTTILSLQHFETAKERMKDFDVKIALLSRFSTAKERKNIIEKLEYGKIDLLIGTHSIISEQVEFYDLGLLIIDEEQRFGVEQKEKLKTKYNKVDVLSISATPIPRTLELSLAGIRDMSLIEQVPEIKAKVHTYCLEYNDKIIKDAILKQKAENGVTFYLHNNTLTLEQRATHLKKLLGDEIRIICCHGKLTRNEIEKRYLALKRHECDVFCCTTIIETGIDIHFANTLIVEHAENMGLSQLHQIRGRIGRGSDDGFCYFTYPNASLLEDKAKKRLLALAEYTEFGAGFSLAVKDLEIRGAGNLLGVEQSGHMDEVGYELYLKLLERAVKKQKEGKEQDAEDCSISISTKAYIDENYIENSSVRLNFYRRFSLIKSLKDYQNVLDELKDRFGTIPNATINLAKVALLRSYAIQNRIKSIKQNDKIITLTDLDNNQKQIKLSFASQALLKLLDEFNIKI